MVGRAHRFAVVVLVDPRGWVLLQERDANPVIAPDRWSFSGGHVEPDETFEEAAYRELAEETGVELEPGTLTLLDEFEVFHEELGTLDAMQVFVAPTTLADADIDCREGRQIVFVDPVTLGELRLSAAATLILPVLLASDLYRKLTS